MITFWQTLEEEEKRWVLALEPDEILAELDKTKSIITIDATARSKIVEVGPRWMVIDCCCCIAKKKRFVGWMIGGIACLTPRYR